jgi:hypothetical protein
MASNPIDVRRIADVQRLVKVLASLNPLDSFSRLPAAVADVAWPPFQFRFFDRMPPVPAWVWIDTGDQVIVSLAGILTPQDGLAVFTNSLQPLTRFGAFSAADQVLSAARSVFGALGDRFVGGPRSWVLNGHSYGGSIALVLAAVLAAAGVVQDVQICTFGSPRPGDFSLRDVLAHWTVRRYMSSDDPVPRFPPHPFEAPALTLFTPVLVASQWAQYVQPQGGVVLWPDGTITVGQRPPQLLPITDLTLAGWALSDRGFFATGHRVSEYAHRVDLAAAAVLPSASNPIVGSPPERPAVLDAQTQQALATGAVPNPLSPLGGFPVQGFIPPQFRAKAVKTGPLVYKVMWMGRNVLTGTNRSNARSLARGVNGWLRRMQGAQSADHTAFNASLADYWLVCVSSSLGFNPPLVVT